MFLAHIVAASLALFPLASVFAAPLPRPDVGVYQRTPLSAVSLFAAAQSRMDQALSPLSKLPSSTETSKRLLIHSTNTASSPSALDLTALNHILSTTNDVSDSLATALQEVDPSVDTLMVDVTDNKLSDEELSTKIFALLKSFETACSTTKSTGSGEIANVMQMIALNIEDMNDALERISPNVSRNPLVAKGVKDVIGLIDQMVNEILGPESR